MNSFLGSALFYVSFQVKKEQPNINCICISSFCSRFALLSIVMPGIRICNSASYYILIFGKLLHIYKVIHIDLKPRILIASFFISIITNKLMLMIFFLYFRKKEKGLLYIDVPLHRVIV